MRLKSWETTEREGEIVTEWVRTEIRVPDSMTPSNYEFRVARATSSSFAFGVREKKLTVATALVLLLARRRTGLFGGAVSFAPPS